jgi:hypothetical protein
MNIRAFTGCEKGKVPSSTLPWNPTLAHKTRKDGAPALMK